MCALEGVLCAGDKNINHLDLRSKSENATCARVDVIAARLSSTHFGVKMTMTMLMSRSLVLLLVALLLPRATARPLVRHIRSAHGKFVECY